LDHCTTGDGLVAALQLLAIVKREDKPVSQLCRRFEPVPQILKNVRLKAGRSLADASVAAAIEDGREKLGKNGRLVVRASGTEPVIRVMGEGDDRDLLERIVDDICAALSASLQLA
jgi:phosphoglucosamine mutase